MGDREVGEQEGDSIFNSTVSQSFLEQDDCIPSWEESKYIKYTFWASLQSLMKTLGKGKNSHKFCHHEICSPSHFLNCFLSACPFASASFLSSHSQPSHNFRHCWIEKKSSAPSQVSLFMTLWYPNITHVLSRGVKVSTLKEVWWKKHLARSEGCTQHPHCILTASRYQTHSNTSDWLTTYQPGFFRETE